MPCRPRVPSRHLGVVDYPNLSFCINEIGSDVQLVRFPVYHAVGRRAPYAFGPNDLPQIGRNLIKFVGGSIGFVWSVSDDPQATGPRDHSTRPAFAFFIVHGQAWVDTRNANRRSAFGRLKQAGEHKEEDQRAEGSALTKTKRV